MKEIKFTIDADGAGVRIDKCIAERLGVDYSRTYVKNLINNGHVRVNGKVERPSYISREGDDVLVEMPPAEKHDLHPEDIPLEIIYEDECVIILNKPPGMVVHPAAGNRTGTMVNALLFHCGNLPETDDEQRPGLVHRLDKDTSGVMVVAKTDRALRSLAKQFQKRAIKKRYVALVKGRVAADNGVVEAPVARHPVDRKKMDVEHARGKPARTVYHVKQRFRGLTFLELEPETGRTHQIRVHMKHIGHPVLGDTTYGKADGAARQALHAEMLGFTHPDTGKYVEFHAPMPEDMQALIRKAEE